MVSEEEVLPLGVRKTIQQIREIVGNHSDADIYSTLKETNMDPNETTQKLLHQDPYHEVKRKRDKKKEQHQAQQHQAHQAQQHQAHQHQAQQTHQSHHTYQKHQSHQTRQSHQNPVYKGSTASEPKQNTESGGHSVNPAMYSNRNVRRAGYGRNGMFGVSREFRIVRDNRGKQNSCQDSKSVESSPSPNDVAIPNTSVKSPSVTQKPPFGRNSSNGDNDSHTKQPKDGNISATVKKDLLGGQRLTVSSTDPQIQPEKENDSQLPSTASSSNSVVGVYSSSSDPVHVPSPDSRPTAKIGAIKREVGVVGAHRQNTETSARLSSSQANSFTNLHLAREVPSRESPRSFGTSSKVDQVHNVVSESGLSVSRSFTNNQYGRGHQLAGHQKAPQPNKEWKPKSSQRTSMNGPGVIGSPTNAAIPSLDISKDAGRESADLEDKMSQVNLAENQNVILASNIRVPDQFRLVFGSLDPDLTLKSGFQAVGSPEELPETSARLQIPEPSHNEAVNSKPQDLVEDHARNSGTDSPASASVSDNQLNDKKEEVSSSTNLDNYGDVRLAQDHNVAYGSQEAQQHQEVSEMQTFQPPYDHNQHAYEMSYFPTIDEHVRAQGLPSPQEVINPHSMSSSMAMVQQQQQAMAQMYPQVHYNMMPYRQYPTAVYVPQMVPSYSSNPTYPHPSNGGNYVLMPPGNSSHVAAANGLKYGIQQFKPVPPGNPTPFGSYTTPAGYTPGVVGSAPGLEDPSRHKFKDGNFYLPNPQAETSEIWMNPRDMQPGSYYNMPGQAPPHAAAYMPSHGGHASYNPAAAAAHSTHMQYPGLYHPTPQAAAMPGPHHMGPAMGGNIGVAAAGAGPQVGAYQQPPQLGHLSWPGSF